MPKVLLITNLFPYVENRTSGVFINNRLKCYGKFNVEYTAIPIVKKDSKLVHLLKSFLIGNYTTPLTRCAGVKYEPVYLHRNFFSLLMSELSWKYVSLNVKQCSHMIEEKYKVDDYDLIHAHGMFRVPAGVVAYDLSRKYAKPFVITIHGSDVNLMMKKWRKYYTSILQEASKVIFVSNALLEKAKAFGYSGKNAVVIPNGYDPEIFYPVEKDIVRKEIGIYKEGYKYVGFVGNLIKIKRADKLPEIFNMVSRSIRKVKFIVVGEGRLRKKVEKEMKERNLESVFTGRVDQKEVVKWMNAMDVMILPSRNEGWPCVVLEAQACGTCVIGSNNGGIPEAIGFEEYVVEEGEHFEERFAQKVVEVLEEGYDRKVLLNRAKEYAWENIVLREKQMYEEVERETIKL